MPQTCTSHDLLTLTEAAKRLPTRPNSCTVWRWCRRGVLSRNGERIRLEHMRLGGRIFIAEGAIEKFGRALAESDGEHFQATEPAAKPIAARTRSEAEQTARAQRAMEQLRARGIDC